MNKIPQSHYNGLYYAWSVAPSPHIPDLSYGDSSLCHSAADLMATLLLLRESEQASTCKPSHPAVLLARSASPKLSRMFAALLFFRSLLECNFITENFSEHLIHKKATLPPTSPEPLACFMSLYSTNHHLHGAQHYTFSEFSVSISPRKNRELHGSRNCTCSAQCCLFTT